MKKLLDKTFLRFAVVGIINTIVGTTIMFVFYNVFHFSYWVSSASNYIVGSILSFFLNKYFTFQNYNRDVRIVLRFIVNIAVCYFAAYSIAKPLVSWILSGAAPKVQGNLAMLAGMGIFTLLNYFGQKFFAFREREKDNRSPRKGEKQR